MLEAVATLALKLKKKKSVNDCGSEPILLDCVSWAHLEPNFATTSWSRQSRQKVSGYPAEYASTSVVFFFWIFVNLLNYRASVTVQSNEIARASLHVALPWYTHLYTIPFLSLYPLLAYAYYIKYDDWLKSEEWTFLACVSLGAGHALSFLVTRWSAAAKAWITTRKVCSYVYRCR